MRVWLFVLVAFFVIVRVTVTVVRVTVTVVRVTVTVVRVAVRRVVIIGIVRWVIIVSRVIVHRRRVIIGVVIRWIVRRVILYWRCIVGRVIYVIAGGRGLLGRIITRRRISRRIVGDGRPIPRRIIITRTKSYRRHTP